MKTTGFIVVFDDEQGLCVPYGWSDACAGAIATNSNVVAYFPTREAARKAIQISAAYARLCVAQGVPADTDFTESAKSVKVLPLTSAEAQR